MLILSRDVEFLLILQLKIYSRFHLQSRSFFFLYLVRVPLLLLTQTQARLFAQQRLMRKLKKAVSEPTEEGKIDKWATDVELLKKLSIEDLSESAW